MTKEELEIDLIYQLADAISVLQIIHAEARKAISSPNPAPNGSLSKIAHKAGRFLQLINYHHERNPPMDRLVKIIHAAEAFIEKYGALLEKYLPMLEEIYQQWIKQKTAASAPQQSEAPPPLPNEPPKPNPAD